MELFSSSLMYPVTDLLLKPIFLHGFSASLHLILLLVLFVSWFCKKLKVGGSHSEGSKERFKNKRVLCYNLTLFCCLGVSVFNLVLCLLSYFYWYRNRWSDENLVTLLDLVLRTLGWGAICVSLYTQFFNSGEKKFPFLLRVWWGIYLSISCYCLVIDVVPYKRHVSLPVQLLGPDVVSVISGLFFCYVGFSVKNVTGEEDTHLEEPLLDGNFSVFNGVASSISSKGADSVTPYSDAGLFSIITFSWMGSLIAVGNKKTLDLEDVPQFDSGDSVVGAFPILRNKLDKDGGIRTGVTALILAKALIFFCWKEILLTALLAHVYTLASYVGPYLIDSFVQYLNGRWEFKNEGYLLVSAFFVAKLVECLSMRHWFFRLQQIGIRIRAVLIVMIYNKGMTPSCQAKQAHTSGEMINVMTVDAERIGDFSWYINDPWMILLQVVLALLILYKNLGLASIATLFTTIVVMLTNFPLGRLQEKFQDKLMESKDKRKKETSEILRNMRILKLQGWEMKFLSNIIELRKIDTGWLKKYVYTTSITCFVFWVALTFVSVTTFGACMFICTGNLILQVPIYNLPDTMSMIIQTKVSLDRIASFLRLDDLQSGVVEKQPRGSSDTAIEIVNGNFSWDITSPNPTLKDINLKVLNGMRVAVCGTVGSGKSSLLSYILGEMPKLSGVLKLCGTKAYVTHSPWIQSGKL